MRSKKYHKPPIGTFEEEVDPIGFAKIVSAEYGTMENGYHAQLRAFLQKAYHSCQLFREYPDAFEKLKRAPFWKASRQRPKDLTTSRWVLLIIMQAKTSNVRVRASKYAKILDQFERDGIKVAQVADRIKKLGGVEAAYRLIVAAEQRRSQASADGGTEERHNSSAPGAACLTQRRRKSSWREDGGRNEIAFHEGYGECARRSPADVVL